MRYDPSCTESCEIIFEYCCPHESHCVLFYKVLHQLNLSPDDLSLSEEKQETAKAKSPRDFVPAGHKIGKPAPLFKEMVRLCI